MTDSVTPQDSTTIRATLRKTALELLAQREYPNTMCPSEPPRAALPNQWRDLMPLMHQVVHDLVQHHGVEVCQKGEHLSDYLNTGAQGPYRLRHRPPSLPH